MAGSLNLKQIETVWRLSGQYAVARLLVRSLPLDSLRCATCLSDATLLMLSSTGVRPICVSCGAGYYFSEAMVTGTLRFLNIRESLIRNMSELYGS